MSKAVLPRKPRVIGGRKNLAVVASSYNEAYVNAMIEACKAEIKQSMPGATVPIYRVPGAFEIPVCTEYVVRYARADVVIALGVIVRGETGHAELIAASVTNALQEISRTHLIPVIHEVLLLDNEDQAKERCFGTQLNRGTEAARVAVSMTELFQKLDITYPHAKTQA